MTQSEEGAAGMSSMARETFEHCVVPWSGRAYAEWVRAWSGAYPGDPRGMVLIPTEIYQAYQQRTPGQRLTKQAAQRLGYPSVPGEQELQRVRRELHDALGRCDWDHAHDLDIRLRELQDRVAAMRHTALKQRALGSS